MRRNLIEGVREIFTVKDMIYAPSKKSKRDKKKSRSMAKKMKLMR